MITNKRIDRLIEIAFVSEFISRNNFSFKLCNRRNNFTFIIFRLPYVIEVCDYLIENYLAMKFLSLDEDLLIDGNAALTCSVDLGLQDLTELRQRNFHFHPNNNIFLSAQADKMGDLHSNLEAIDKLFPLIEEIGLSSMRNGLPDVRVDFRNYVDPMYADLKARYLECIRTAERPGVKSNAANLSPITPCTRNADEA